MAESVAPSTHELGVMLPYSPLHHLILGDCGAPLVMTSANVSDEPIAYRDEDALERLGSIADLFLLHDRPIHTRTDDSVVRVAGDGVLFLRRSRGYVPAGLPLRVPHPMLACGAELKCTFAVAKGDRAWVGHHIGDLKNYETLRSYQEGIEHFERLFAVAPKLVAHDLHPEYLSTKYALEREGVETIGVQHHHAHLASCLAEHREEGPAVGAIFDGTGLGTDGAIWGGEILAGDAVGFERLGHLRTVPMPGGERAIRQPWRMACAWLLETLGSDPPIPPRIAGELDCRGMGDGEPPRRERTRIAADLERRAALRRRRGDLRHQDGGQLRGAGCGRARGRGRSGERGAYPLPGAAVLDARETIRAVLADLGAGVPIPTVAARFHNGIAAGTAAACVEAASTAGVGLVVLSGGVFQNRLLLERTTAILEQGGLRVLVPRLLPPNDGGIALGQLAIAAREPLGGRAPPRGPARAEPLPRRHAPAAVLDRVRAHRPRVPSESPVCLPQVRLELAAMLAARVASTAVDPVAAPDQPIARLDVEVLAEEQLLKLALEASLRGRVRPGAAELAPKEDAAGHLRWWVPSPGASPARAALARGAGRAAGP